MTGNKAPDAQGEGSDDIVFFQGEMPFEYRNSYYYGDAKVKGHKLSEVGAAPTALAMIANNISMAMEPNIAFEMSKDYITEKGSEIDILTDVEKFNLKVTKIGKDTTKLYEALQDGKMAIAVTGSKEEGGVTGIFNRTSDCNFIVILGTDDDGYLKVADPDGGNYYNLKEYDVTYQLLKGEAVGGFYIYERLN